MKLKRLLNFKQDEWAPIVGVLTADMRHYNITHGNRSKSTWEIKLGVDDVLVKKELESNYPTVILNKSFYVLKPVYNKYTNEQVKDLKGYERYYLSIDTNKENDSILVFINVPPMNIKSAKYQYDGDITVLSIAEDMSIVNNKTYIMDAPIVLMGRGSSVTITAINGYEEEEIYILQYKEELKLEKG